ncbi:MAG: hypothetical protein RLZ97_2014, partial [Verrucomicrobiota bacterium]
METGLLPGKRGRPRWASTCFLNSSEEIERREDKISCIRSSLISGRMGEAFGRSVFTWHEDRAESVWGQTMDRADLPGIDLQQVPGDSPSPEAVASGFFEAWVILEGARISKSRTHQTGSKKRRLEAEVGIEPTNGSFANFCLTTWLLRRLTASGAGRGCYASRRGLSMPGLISTPLVLRNGRGPRDVHPPAMSDAVRLLYSQHRYPALSHAEAHPGTLCAAARCGGVIDPALPDDCDVLEIGCASGHHLLPLAARFPQSRFLGIDFSDTAIRQARKAAEAAGLGNIRFEHADLIEWDPAGRDFDYILAHGMLSWTADPVKAALLLLIGRCLREKGIACIGYNTLPGWSLRREAAQMTKALGKLDTQGRGVDGILETLATAAAKNATPYAHHLAAIYQDMRRKGPEILAFDDLGPCCDPLHFSQVIHWAGRNRLRYIGESQLHQNLPPGLSPEALDALEPLTDDPILFQQTLDLLSGRTHRSSLFTTAGTNLDPITTTSVTLHFEARLLLTSLPAGAAHGEILATFQAALAAA